MPLDLVALEDEVPSPEGSRFRFGQFIAHPGGGGHVYLGGPAPSKIIGMLYYDPEEGWTKDDSDYVNRNTREENDIVDEALAYISAEFAAKRITIGQKKVRERVIDIAGLGVLAEQFVHVAYYGKVGHQVIDSHSQERVMFVLCNGRYEEIARCPNTEEMAEKMTRIGSAVITAFAAGGDEATNLHWAKRSAEKILKK